jgi:UDP-glucose 4-epimerase
VTNVLVTGGAGYVGSVCCRRLLEEGHKVVVIDDLSSGRAAAVPGGASLYILDYGDRAGVARLLGHTRIDAVFHFAAKALIPESVSNPGVFFDINVSSAIAFLEVLRQFGVKRFVFSSSAAVYGNPQSDFIDEGDPREPVNSYGESKLIFERVLRWYAAAYGWTVAAFRYFNASGATREAGEDHQPETHIIPLLLDVAAGERPAFEIYGDDYDTPDGTGVRDYVHVSDIAAAHMLALNLPHRAGMRIYNIGCGKGYSVREVIAAVQQVTGRKIPVRISARRPGDPPALCASPARIEREMRWKPVCSDLHHIIRTAWEWKINSRTQRAVYEPKLA